MLCVCVCVGVCGCVCVWLWLWLWLCGNVSIAERETFGKNRASKQTQVTRYLAGLKPKQVFQLFDTDGTGTIDYDVRIRAEHRP